jgi:NADH-quinone oxidoreductase subunit J
MSAATILMHFVAATRPDALVFVWTAVVIIVGALGVVICRNPVHSALMLIMTLFGVAVIFIELQANFLAAVQVIVYAGAIVVLFLFVIMLLGVDKQENLETEPLRGQRPIAIALVALALGGVLALGIESHWAVGAHAVAGARHQDGGDVAALGRSVFTTYLFPFEVTAALLVIAVVGAVVLSRQSGITPSTGPESEDEDEESTGVGDDPAGESEESADASEDTEPISGSDTSAGSKLATADESPEPAPSSVSGRPVSVNPASGSPDSDNEEVRT